MLVGETPNHEKIFQKTLREFSFSPSPRRVRGGKGVNKVEFTSKDIERIRHQFDAFCKKVVKYEARSIYRQQARLAEHEVSLFDFPEAGANLFAVTDDYITDEQRFSILGYDIAIKSELLAEAIRLLPDSRRDIILLYYFLGLNDREIANRLNAMHRTISYQRTSSLKLLKKILEEIENEENK